MDEMKAEQTPRQLEQTDVILTTVRAIIVKVGTWVIVTVIGVSAFIWYTTKRTAEKVGEQANDITVLQQDVKGLTSDVARLNNMTDDVAEIKTDIRELKTMIYEELRKK